MNIVSKSVARLFSWVKAIKASLGKLIKRTNDRHEARRLPIRFPDNMEQAYPVKIRRTRKSLGPSAKSVLHLLQDANRQLEFFKWKPDPPDGFSWISHEISVAGLEERKADKHAGERKFRSFDKAKLGPDPDSLKVLNEQIARRRHRRTVCIQTADGATFRGCNVLNSPTKPYGVTVVNGQFPADLGGTDGPFPSSLAGQKNKNRD